MKATKSFGSTPTAGSEQRPSSVASIGVHYRPRQMAEHLRYPTPFAALTAQLQLLLDDREKVESHSLRLIEIPVC